MFPSPPIALTFALCYAALIGGLLLEQHGIDGKWPLILGVFLLGMAWGQSFK